jgi:TolB-like protein
MRLVRPGGNNARLKGRVRLARLAILGWGGAKRASPDGRAQTCCDLRRRHSWLQPVDGARRGCHARPAEGLPGYHRRLIASHRGRIFNTAGDSVVADFASAVDAVQCAVAVQAAIATENAGGTSDEPMQFRIGVHVGDVMVDGENLLGEGVNIAARLESLADPGAICVSAAARDHIGNKLPLDFDDIGEQQVKNIAQPIRVYRVRAEAPTPQPSTVLPLPDKPSIAVLPFQNMSGDPEQEYFVDGMVEEIITALSRIHWLFVIARNSTFTYKGRAVDVKEVGRELGVRYVLEGSVRKAGTRVRIAGQLIDALTGTHLWADRFDGSLEDVFELQDKIAVSVAGVIEPALQAAEMRRSATRPPTDLSAYDLYLRALTAFYPIRREGLVTALGLFEQAIAIDRHYAPALSWAAICHLRLVTEGWTEAPEHDRQRGIDLARRALRFGENDPRILANAAVGLANLGGEDIGAMMGLVDRALTLNLSFARGWNLSGLLRVFAGQHDLAIEHIETALRLSPRERVGVPLQVIGMAYFFKRQFDEAEAKLLLAIQEHPETPATYRTLAACYARMGRLDEARAIVAKLRAITPQVMQSHLPFRRPEDRELLLSGLRLAIGETT